MTFFDHLAADFAPPFRLCAEDTVQRLLQQDTSSNRPGILLGKVQSGKTRLFLSVIGLAFDKGYDVAVILTKGTKSLARQTLKRVHEQFHTFRLIDAVQFFDIMFLPTNLTPFELGQKLILVVQKEDDNLRRLISAVQDQYPQLQKKKFLFIDDEADTASLSFRKVQGQVNVGVISSQIDTVKDLVTDSDYLQVTATPYSLYLQPDEDVHRNGSLLFSPRRPAFTVILPIHADYIGGDHYFEKSSDPQSPAYYFYEPVPIAERDSLKAEDRRRLKIENVLQEKNSAVLVRAVVNFIVGGTMRRMQQRANGDALQKYGFLFHTEFSRASHDWQERLASAINADLVSAAQHDTPVFDTLLKQSFEDLKRSLEIAGTTVFAYTEVRQEIKRALADGHMMITKVNSESDVEALLDDDGQLRLRTPLNMFIGGQILDRGITITNLIGFYYGRNPQKFQQDTVLQHCRMYGARPKADLPVTRFYSPPQIYQIMKRIHEFDGALREAFLNGSHERGVYFIQRDAADRLVPCSPNKLMFSNLTTIRPGRRVVPVDFQTVSKTDGRRRLEELDRKIRIINGDRLDGSLEIEFHEAVKLAKQAFDNLEFDDSEDEQERAFVAMLEHYSRQCAVAELTGKVHLIVASDRDVARYREGGRFSDAPDTKQQADEARQRARDIPALMLLRQNGKEENQWRGLPFWWPVLVTPQNAATSVFAARIPRTP